MYDLTYEDPIPIQAADDEPGWSERAQNVLSYVLEVLGEAAHPDVRRKTGVNIPAATWATARELLDLCDLVRHSGTPPAKDHNTTANPHSKRTGSRARKCKRVESE